MIQFKRQFSKKSKLALVIASAVLLSIPWEGASCITIFVGLVPLMLISAQYGPSRREAMAMLGWATLAFVLWNAATIWWVWNASPAGPITATIVSTWWNLVPFMLFHILSKRTTKVLAYTTFIASWIAAEYIYTDSPAMSFPWLVLGNGFADDTWAVQWYEYTGVFGGSLWVLLVNVLAFEACLTMRKRVWVVATLALAIPICISIGLFYKYDAEGDYYSQLEKTTVSVAQPNIPCYGRDSKTDPNPLVPEKHHKILLNLLEEVPDSTEFILMPETSLEYSVNESRPTQDLMVDRIVKHLQTTRPSAMVVAGTTTVHNYGATKATETAREDGNTYYDLFNSSLGIDASGDVQIHHKGKLVVGTEIIPSWLRGVGNAVAVQLGEDEFTEYGIGTEQKPFEHNGKKVAPAICYEGLYGDHMAEFARNGAEALFVASNDGWWDNTPGHKYLFKFCRLRAIETRRDVARSANTGVSGFITMRGDDGERLEWDQRGVLTADIRLNDEQTFYTKYGDYIGRLSLYIAALCLLYLVATWAKKKFYLN